MRRLSVGLWLICAIGLFGVSLEPSSANAENAARIGEWGPVRTLDPGRLLMKEVDSKLRIPVVSNVAVTEGGQRWITCGDDHLVRIWDSVEGKQIGQLKGHHDWVRTVGISPDGQTLATAGDDQLIRLWDLDSNKERLSIQADKQGAISTLAFRSDGKQLVATGFHKEKKLWLIDLASGKITKTLTGPSVDMRTVRYSPDGKYLAAAGRTGIVRLWENDRLDNPVDLKGRRRISAIAFSSDSKRIVAGGDAGEVWVWNVDSSGGSSTKALPRQSGRIMALAFCGKNNQLLAVGGSDNRIRIWELATGTKKADLVGHKGSITSLVWDKKSESLISSSFDTTVRQWRLDFVPGDRISENQTAVPVATTVDRTQAK
jgi:WD40 repeat protein